MKYSDQLQKESCSFISMNPKVTNVILTVLGLVCYRLGSLRYCTLVARRLTASSLRLWISGVPGQLLLLFRKVLVALGGGVGWGGWLRGRSVLEEAPPGRTESVRG